jgi:hypothetical protein
MYVGMSVNSQLQKVKAAVRPCSRFTQMQDSLAYCTWFVSQIVIPLYGSQMNICVNEGTSRLGYCRTVKVVLRFVG